jgi:hypothetical protein
MPTVYLAPDPINGTQFFPGGNTPAAGAQLFCFKAGTTTHQDMYTDISGTTKWTNPILLDSGGNLGGSNEIWIPAGLPAKFVLAPSNDQDPPLSPYWTRDNISGVNDPTGIQSEWVPSGLVPTFISANSFSLSGDQTAVFTFGRKLKTINTSGTVYGTITSSVFGIVTTVTIITEAGIALDSGLSSVFYGLLNPINNSAPDVFSKNTSAAMATYNNSSGSNFIEFITAGGIRVATGALSAEANLSFNMDYTNNVHRLYAQGVSATWLTVNNGASMTLQYAPATATTSDVWVSQGRLNNAIVDTAGNFVIRGKASLPKEIMTLVAGNNFNVPLPSTGYCRATGPTTSFAIGGIVAPVSSVSMSVGDAYEPNLTELTIFNNTPYPMTISHADAGESTAAYKIYCRDNSSFAVGVNGLVKLGYESVFTGWIVLGRN